MARQEHTPRLIIILVLSMICWGSTYPVSKYIMGSIHPAFMAFLRHSGGCIPLIPFFFIERKRLSKSIPPGHMVLMSLIGFYGIGGFALLLFFGVHLSSASTGSTLTNTQPIFAVILSPLLLRERISRRDILGSLIGLTGVVLVTTGGRISSLTSGERFFLGNLLLLGASVSMTLYTIALKKYIRLYGGLIPTFITMVSGSLVLLAASWVLSNPVEQLSRIQGPWDILLIIYLGIFATALPFFLFNHVLRFFDVVKAAGFKFLIPVTGVGLSMAALGERPDGWTLFGTAVVIFAVILLQSPSKKTIDSF